VTSPRVAPGSVRHRRALGATGWIDRSPLSSIYEEIASPRRTAARAVFAVRRAARSLRVRRLQLRWQRVVRAAGVSAVRGGNSAAKGADASTAEAGRSIRRARYRAGYDHVPASAFPAAQVTVR